MNAELLQMAGARERIDAALGRDPLELVARCANGCGRRHAPGPKRLCAPCRADNRKATLRRYRQKAA